MFDWLFELTRTNPVAHAIGLLSLVCAAGMALGSIKVKGIGLGSSGVLFFGILAAQFSQSVDRQTLAFVRELGLVLFVFAMGLQLGPTFFASLKAEGLRLNGLAAVIVLAAGMLAPLLGWLLGMDHTAIAGLFAGASTNIPALGAAQQSLATLPGLSQEQLALPALACAVSYPAAIVGSLTTLLVLKTLFRTAPDEVVRHASHARKSGEPLNRRAIVVDNEELAGCSLDDAYRHAGGGIVVSRMRAVGEREVQLAHGTTRLALGDTLLAVGNQESLDRFEQKVGRRSDEDLMAATGHLTFSRVAITSRSVLGRTIAELDLNRQFGVEATRMARGDVEIPILPGLKLQFGDVLQLVGTEENLQAASAFLGNSLKKLSETQFIPLFLGISLGVIVGSMPIAVPGLTAPLRLGLAGGPLLVALVVGRIGHFRGLVWHMPISANHAFREFGIALFFAALGLAAGDQFISAVMSDQGIKWLLAGFLVCVVPLFAIGIVARVVFRMNFASIGGLLAGATTNPPALAFVNNLCRSESPTLAYATVYPVATMLRILVAQVLAVAVSS